MCLPLPRSSREEPALWEPGRPPLGPVRSAEWPGGTGRLFRGVL